MDKLTVRKVIAELKNSKSFSNAFCRISLYDSIRNTYLCDSCKGREELSIYTIRKEIKIMLENSSIINCRLA